MNTVLYERVSPSQRTRTTPEPTSRRNWIALAIPLGCGLWGVSEQGPWCDELFTLMDASRGFIGGIKNGLQFYTAPLFPAVAWVTTGGGTWLLGARLLGVLAFVGTAWCAGRCADDLAGPRAGVLAILFVGTNPLLLWHAQDARPYALFVFFTAAAVASQVRHLARRRTDFPWPLYLMASLGLLTHLYTGCTLAALGLVLLFTRGNPATRSSWRALILAGLTALPVLLVLLAQSRSGDAGFHKPTDLKALAYSMATMGNGYAFGPTLAELHGPNPMAAMKPHLVEVALRCLAWWSPLLLGLWCARARLGSRHLHWFAAAILPLVLPFAASLALGGVSYNTRYILPAVSLALVLAAVGLGAGNGRRSRVFAPILALLFIQVWGIAGLRTQERYGKEDYAGAASFLATEMTAADRAFSGPMPGMLNYLLGTEQVGLLNATTGLPPREAGEPGRDFLVFDRPWDMDPDGVLEAQLQKEGCPSFELRGFRIYQRNPIDR